LAVVAAAPLACAPAAVAPASSADRDERDAAARDARRSDSRAVADGFSLPDVVGTDVAPRLGKVLVYAHSGSDLFRVDPETFAIERAGNLTELVAGKIKYLNDVTDIAVDRDGHILGLRANRMPTVSELVTIDPDTAVCTRVADLPGDHQFNGLSFIKTPDGGEYLAGITVEGALFRIDPTSGAATLVGPLGPGLGSSGDLVSVTGYGTLATLVGSPDDQLARIDPLTGHATVIGTVAGYQKIYGLGFWRDRVIGFTNTGQLIRIDPKTAAATLVSADSAYPYAGAGVTTSVPVVVE
jgi:hypothetical protein